MAGFGDPRRKKAPPARAQYYLYWFFEVVIAVQFTPFFPLCNRRKGEHWRRVAPAVNIGHRRLVKQRSFPEPGIFKRAACGVTGSAAKNLHYYGLWRHATQRVSGNRGGSAGNRMEKCRPRSDCLSQDGRPAAVGDKPKSGRYQIGKLTACRTGSPLINHVDVYGGHRNGCLQITAIDEPFGFLHIKRGLLYSDHAVRLWCVSRSLKWIGNNLTIFHYVIEKGKEHKRIPNTHLRFADSALAAPWKSVRAACHDLQKQQSDHATRCRIRLCKRHTF